MTTERHRVRVRVLSHEVTFAHKSRGRVTGTDHRTVITGYQPECRDCGWIGTRADYPASASAEAASHDELRSTP